MPEIDSERFERETVERLVEVLGELPESHVLPAEMQWNGGPNWRADARINLQLGGKQYALLVEVKKSIYPRDAQQVLWQMQRYAQELGIRDRKALVVPILAAQSISPGAKELLRSEHCGYFDGGGSLFIPARGAYIYIDRPPPKTLEKSIRSLFRGKRSQVLQALLLHHEEWFGVKELAELAAVSPATASETLSSLERFEWLSVRGQGPSKERLLSEPGALLDEWVKRITSATRRLTYSRFYVPGGKPDEIADRLAHACARLDLSYAFTQEFAAQIYAPFLTSVSRVSCRLALGPRAGRLYEELDARPVEEGANLDIIETRSSGELHFKEHVGTLWLASPVQVYLDLQRRGGRGKDAAEHLRRERLGF